MGVLTAPLAVVMKDGNRIGYMRNISITEDIQRGEVYGLGELTKQEAPAIRHAGSGSCEFFEVDFNSTGIPDIIKRTADSIQAWVDNVLLQEDGVDLVIYKKIQDFVDDNGLIRGQNKVHASISQVLLNRETLNIPESQIATHGQEFIYLDPIVYYTS